MYTTGGVHHVYNRRSTPCIQQEEYAMYTTGGVHHVYNRNSGRCPPSLKQVHPLLSEALLPEGLLGVLPTSHAEVSQKLRVCDVILQPTTVNARREEELGAPLQVVYGQDLQVRKMKEVRWEGVSGTHRHRTLIIVWELYDKTV